jgi:hypothetical protein
MTAPKLEFHETTVLYDHEVDEVVVYTTRTDIYEALLARQTQPVRHRALQPGYELIYRSADCIDPATLVA